MVISHKQWIEYAQNMEKAEAYETCRCIVHNTLPIGIENEDRRHTWTADAESCIQSGFTHTARAIYAYSLAIFQGILHSLSNSMTIRGRRIVG